MLVNREFSFFCSIFTNNFIICLMGTTLACSQRFRTSELSRDQAFFAGIISFLLEIALFFFKMYSKKVHFEPAQKNWRVMKCIYLLHWIEQMIKISLQVFEYFK
jgi:hypothetical protein